MRISLPDEHADNPIYYLRESYCPEMVTAGLQFSKSVYQHSKLSLREFEAARIRSAEINGCLICKNWRSERDLPTYFETMGGDAQNSVMTRGPAPNEAFYLNISDWQQSSEYSVREKLAAEYAERFGCSPQELGYDEEFWDRFKAHYSDAEVVDLTYVIAAMVALGRVAHVLGLDTNLCPFDVAAE